MIVTLNTRNSRFGEVSVVLLEFASLHTLKLLKQQFGEVTLNTYIYIYISLNVHTTEAGCELRRLGQLFRVVSNWRSVALSHY